MSTLITSIFNNLNTVAVIAGGFFAGTALYTTVGLVPALRATDLDVQ